MTLTRLRLEPVLELEPGRFSNKEHAMPSKSASEDPPGWDRYWRECLSDSGLVGLQTLDPGSWMVPTSTLTAEDQIAQILTVQLNDLEPLSIDDQPVLMGGVALLSGGKPIIEPQCCSDLANQVVWKAIADCEDESWQAHWIGHPQIRVRRQGRWLELSEPDDEAAPETRWRLDPTELKAGLPGVRRELERLSEIVLRILSRRPGLRKAERLARCLAGLGE